MTKEARIKGVRLLARSGACSVPHNLNMLHMEDTHTHIHTMKNGKVRD
jgi:hypothetical protein